MDLLCSFAHRFPLLAAELLERDRHKRRNFREETITDVLMAGLVPFEPLDIVTNYPANESLTGEDMDWEFVNEHATDGRRYLRVHIQAKRAILSGGKKAPYWFYRELDHAVASKVPFTPKLHGTQHKLLIKEAKKVEGCVPLYMFYHPVSALGQPSCGLPAVEGVNWMFADLIPTSITASRWPIGEKKLAKWRQHFHSLTDLLCFGHDIVELVLPDGSSTGFMIRSQPASPSPGEIADRLNELRGYTDTADGRLQIHAVRDIPESTLAAVRVARDGRRIADLKRPRAIFVSGPVRHKGRS